MTGFQAFCFLQVLIGNLYLPSVQTFTFTSRTHISLFLNEYLSKSSRYDFHSSDEDIIHNSHHSFKNGNGSYQIKHGLFMSSADESMVDFVKADDGEALQALFEQQCDEDGLMTKASLVSIPMIADLLSVGDLLQEELDDIWSAAPKFPDLESSSPQRIDVDSFIEIYRDIDDIFEDEEDDDDTDKSKSNKVQANGAESDKGHDGKSTGVNVTGESVDKELNIAFYSICDENSFVSKDSLKNWSEIQDLFEENMLDEDEFHEIWDKTVQNSNDKDQIGLDGFVAFNEELDKLFVLDDDDEGEEAIDEDSTANKVPIQLFYGDDLPAGVIFSELANDEFLVGMNELKRWGDLQDMLKEGDLLPIELQNMFEQIAKAPGTEGKLNEEGFESLYNTIEALFEDEEEEEGEDEMVLIEKMKKDLLNLIDDFGCDEERMPCGLESTESEMQQILTMVAELEGQPSNIVLSSGGDVIPSEVAGDWELLYTTSSTMKFNKGLSGLVPPNGKFGGLRQTLKASKYLADIEYIEQINAGPGSFEVRVTGDWELRNSVSLFTGSRSVALSVEPDKVNYGLTSQRADHWKSLGPLNLLDIAYLDDDLRIMRGTTSTESVFIFRKTQ